MFGSYKSKHSSAYASGISRLSRGIKATLTFSRLRTRHSSRVRVTYTQKLTPLATFAGYGLIRPEVPDIGWNTIALANVRRMGRMGTRDRGISGGWGCKAEREKLKEIYLEREKKRRKERDREAEREECTKSFRCTQWHLHYFPLFALFNRISPVRPTVVIYVGRWITMNENVY